YCSRCRWTSFNSPPHRGSPSTVSQLQARRTLPLFVSIIRSLPYRGDSHHPLLPLGSMSPTSFTLTRRCASGSLWPDRRYGQIWRVERRALGRLELVPDASNRDDKSGLGGIRLDF